MGKFKTCKEPPGIQSHYLVGRVYDTMVSFGGKGSKVITGALANSGGRETVTSLISDRMMCL